MQITFNADPKELTALLRFLRHVPNEEIKRTLSTWKEVRRYDRASEKLRVALVEKLELGEKTY
jgi:hypothetical protein